MTAFFRVGTGAADSHRSVPSGGCEVTNAVWADDAGEGGKVKEGKGKIC